MQSEYPAQNNLQVKNNVGDTINSKKSAKSQSKGAEQTVWLVILLVIAVFVLLAAAIFTIGATDDTKKILPEEIISFDDTYYWLKCRELCGTKVDLDKCKKSPEGTDMTCVEIFESINDAFESMSGDDPDRASKKKLRTHWRVHAMLKNENIIQ